MRSFRLSLVAVLGAAVALAVGVPAVADPPAVKVAPEQAAPPRLALADPAPAPRPVKADPKKPRGAKKTPAHKLLGIPRHHRKVTVPAQFAYVPPQMSYWLNDRIGDCVSAEEAFALAAWSFYCTGTEVFVPDSVLSKWVYSHGYANGAELPEVMDSMQRDGITVNGVTYKDGPYHAVDYSDEAELQSAISTGPVKIAIDANALPSGAGNRSGWYATGGRPGQYPNTDHCVGLCGYGPASYCFGKLNVPVPGGFSASKTYYLLYTWDTIGVVDEAWIMSTCTEAYVRNPTTVGMTPPAPTPPVPPNPTPTPPTPPTPTPAGPFTGTLVYEAGVLVAVNPGPPPAGLKAELHQAGVSPAIITDVLKLVEDLKGKASFTTLLADIMAIIADLKADAPRPRREWEPEHPVAV